MRRRPVLETERLILRAPDHRDFTAFAAMMADADHTRFMGGRQSAQAARRSLAGTVESWAGRGWGMFAVIEKTTGRWVGQVGPWRPVDQPELWPGDEIGWALSRRDSGRGYALEAAAAAIDFAFGTLGWTDVIHCIDPEDHRSVRLAERLGSLRLGPVDCPAPYDRRVSIAWGQTREAWQGRRAA